MLYPRKEEKQLDRELFRNPSSEYRGTPFWAWNCHVTKEQIESQTEKLHQMGMGGAHIHCRTGMSIPYMSDEFMELVTYAHEKFAEKGMLTWLYDEDRWPSGFGGGLVTRHPEYRERYLIFSPEPIADGFPEDRGRSISAANVIRNDSRQLLMCYGVRLNPDGSMADYHAWKEGEEPPAGCALSFRQEGQPDGASECGAEGYPGEEPEHRGCCPGCEPDGRQGCYQPWYAYLEVSGDSTWFNDQAYVNTLDPKAIAFFLEKVHNRYAEKLGESFGKDIPSIFTDEPQFLHKSRLGKAGDRQAQFIPYTDDFEESYRAAYGESFLEHLPEVFWEMEGKPVSVARYHYHDHIAERFARAYADQIGQWCQEHGLALTGHMMEEPTLMSQTAALGEAMRSYRSFQLPGIDMLCDWRELTTAKQAQSAVNQYAREGMLSELYGVTNWDFDFRGHKLAGDWQAALGVTIRVHHLTWVSMEGEAKRDYPACIGYQSPWYRKYKRIEDYFARLNTALVRGTPLVKIGVIHPIESYWLKWGNEEATGAERAEMDEAFSNLTKWLLYGLLDFDFISEALLEELPDDGKEGFAAGAMHYEVIVVPGCVTLRKNTVNRLKKFAEKGGRIFWLGRIPEYVDAMPAEDDSLRNTGVLLPYTKQALHSALEPYRTVSVCDRRGMKSDNMLSRQRQDGENRWLFLAHCEKPDNMDEVSGEYWTIRVPGTWSVEQYDAMEGTVLPIGCAVKDGCTKWEVVSYAQDSFLYCLKPVCADAEREGGKPECAEMQAEEMRQEAEESECPGVEAEEKRQKAGEPECPGTEAEKMRQEAVEIRNNGQQSDAGGAEAAKAAVQRVYHEVKIPETVSVTLEEPNVLVLDMAQSRLDDGCWREKEEILRLDNVFRSELGYPMRADAYAQPWIYGERAYEHKVSLCYTIQSETEREQVELALENEAITELVWNGEPISHEVSGYYVDTQIHKVILPGLKKGENVLEATLPYHAGVDLEAMYLLGDFGVRVNGRRAVVTEASPQLAFGDICHQGLPFYGGNLVYRIPVELTEDGEVVVQIPKFRNPLIEVILDGHSKDLFLSPYRVSFPDVKKGKHILELRAYGNRKNTFGQLHNCNENAFWCGPDAWRSRGVDWAYEYQLTRTGILVSPRIEYGGQY